MRAILAAARQDMTAALDPVELVHRGEARGA
jgi:hypothetical protein